ncbi:MAG: DUF2399 domain-containing protein [Deltaproteobacteria bacterium]|nr:DUF2399 domain-containing protein [Deltaproteobacteria bacterium]
MDGDVVVALRELVESTPALGEILGAILDRRERLGKIPARMTVRCPEACVGPLRDLLSARAVVAVGDGKVRLDLGLASGSLALDAILYGALGRTPCDPVAEEAQRISRLVAAMDEVSLGARSQAARSWLATERATAERAVGDLVAIAKSQGVDVAAEEARLIARCIDAALDNDSPIRLQNFSARVAGHSKALLSGSERFYRLGQALYEHDLATAREVHFLGDPVSPRDAFRKALEVHQIFRDEAALIVLCFGPLVYEKDGQRFDHVARHARLGECSPLTLAQLRGAKLSDASIDRVTILENQATFLDYVEALHVRGIDREVVILADGQANWAVISLLRALAARRIPMRHSGDLDRSGVLILRSIGRRVGASITPFYMDVETHRAYANHGRPLDPEERERLRALLTTDGESEPAHQLLREILCTGRWIEQEAFAHDAILGSLGAHARDR